MLGVDAPQSLDQVTDPSWLTGAVGASARVPEGSDREGLLRGAEVAKVLDEARQITRILAASRNTAQARENLSRKRSPQ